jgi:hypothetical protein
MRVLSHACVCVCWVCVCVGVVWVFAHIFFCAESKGGGALIDIYINIGV